MAGACALALPRSRQPQLRLARPVPIKQKLPRRNQLTPVPKGENLMMSINQSIICHDPAEASRSESGVFEGVSPGGERFQFVCRFGRSITNVRYAPDRHEAKREW